MRLSFGALVVLGLLSLALGLVVSETEIKVGVTSIGNVGLNEYTIFSFNPYTEDFNNLGDLVFSLTSFAGDADLFVSIEDSINIVGSECRNCIFSDRSTYSGEIKYLSKNETEKWPVEGKPFKIAVFGFQRTAFGLTIASTNTTTELFSGNPVQMIGKMGGSLYFRYNIPSDSPRALIQLSVIKGDADLYVSSSNPRPNSENYDFKAENYLSDSLEIALTETKISVLYIGVFAYHDAVYSVAATVPDVDIKMIEGYKSVGYIQNSGDVIHYTFNNLENYEDIVIESTPLDPDDQTEIYIKYGSRATTENYDFVTYTIGHNSFVIPANNARTGVYYVTVLGKYKQTDFELYFYTQPTNTKTLKKIGDNINLVSTSSNNNAVFKLEHTDTKTLFSFKVTIIQGTVTLYQAYQPVATSTKSERKETSGSEIIMNFDKPILSNYYFVVMSESNALFNVTLSTTSTPIELEDAQQIFLGTVPHGYYRYFRFYADKFSTNDLSVSIKMYEGDCDLYISTVDTQPNVFTYQWASESYGEDTIYILSNNEKAIGKTFYIAVFGYNEGINHFSIVAMQSDKRRVLEDGQAMVSSVVSGKYTYFEFKLEQAASVQFTLSLSKKCNDGDCDEADLYYSTTTPTPTEFNNQGKSMKYGDDVITLDEAAAGTYYIGVKGLYGIGSTISFTMTATTKSTLIYPNGDNVLFKLKKGQTGKFIANGEKRVDTIVTSTSLLFGSTKLFISTNGEPANETNYTWKNEGQLGNVIVTKNSDSGYTYSEWYISVYAEVDTVGYLTLGSSSHYAFKRDVPLLTGVKANDIVVLTYFTNSHNATDMLFSFHKINGNFDIYAVQDLFRTPSPSLYTWKYMDALTGSMIIKAGEIDTSLPIRFAIYAKSDTTARLLLSSRASRTVLPRGSLALMTTQSYYYLDSFPGSDSYMKIVVDSCNSEFAPVVYASNSEQKPTKSSEKTIASSSNSFSFIQEVEIKDINSEKVYIGVSGSTSENPYQIRSIGSVNLAPTLSSTTLASKRGNSTLIIPPASSSNGLFITYEVYLQEITYPAQNLQNINYYTACAMRSNFTHYQKQTVPSGGTNDIEIPLPNISNKKLYLINVVATDSNGLTSVYSPAYVVSGVVSSRPNSLDISLLIGVSVGGGVALILGLLLISFVIYRAMSAKKEMKHGEKLEDEEAGQYYKQK
ncbi:hypothetical protein ABK040_004681 [Willaertia magna]